MKKSFKFKKPGKLVDGDLELVLVRTTPADAAKGYVPGYAFEMRRAGKRLVMGGIRLRIGPAETLRYAGHIGYNVKKRFRGRRYAARSCRLLFAFAREHGFGAVWLTVDPENAASQRTCEIIGAKYVETVRIPNGHEMYREGARYRRRYRVDLRGSQD